MRQVCTPAVAAAAIMVTGITLPAGPPDRANTGLLGPPTSVGRGHGAGPALPDRASTGLPGPPASVGRGLADRPAVLDRARSGLLGPPVDVGRSPAGLDRRPRMPPDSPRGIDPPTDRASRGLDRAMQRGELDRSDRSRDQTSDKRPDVPGNGGGLLGRFFGATEAADTGVGDPSDIAESPDSLLDGYPDIRPPTDRHRGRRWFALSRADRLLLKRLADIDHLRDVAMRNGNMRLLEQADRLEELARHQFARRTAGFDIPGTDPSTDPTDPGVPTDPTVPGVPMDPTSPADPTDPFPIDPLDPVPTDPTPPTDPLEPVPGLNEPGEVILGDIEPVDEPLN